MSASAIVRSLIGRTDSHRSPPPCDGPFHVRSCGWRIVISPIIPYDSPPCYHSSMRHLVVLLIHLIAVLTQLFQPGGVRSLVAESLLLKHQLLILNRSRQRSPNLSSWDRILAGWMALLIRPTRLLRSAIVLKPSTLLALHKAMSKRKYRMLFSPNRHRKPGPKGPSADLIHLVVEMKQRNPNWGCPRIAQQISLAFNIQIDRDVVRRILARHYRPAQDSGGPSWLTFLGHVKDSLWSMDLFRCESATMRTHWVLVVMDQYTRRIIGFGVHAGTVDGAALCRMFNRAIRGQRWMPRYLSSDNDPLYRFHQWQANLRILEGFGSSFGGSPAPARVADSCHPANAIDHAGPANGPGPTINEPDYHTLVFEIAFQDSLCA